MPELPEVENLRRGLGRAILGQRIRRVEVRKPKLVSGKGNIRLPSRKKARKFIRGLTGVVFDRIDRRAKNLIFHLKPRTSNLAPGVMLVHLKMSGQFIYKEHGRNVVVGGHPIESAEKNPLPDKHTHVIFELDRGTLYYNDTRMFGYLLYYPTTDKFEAANHFGLFGLEPFDKGFTPRYLRDALSAKKGMIKAVLMDQKAVVGLGNIYADEVLFEAGVRPDRPANAISARETAKMHAAIKKIIRRAIRLGGSSVATYRLLDDSRGNYAREHKVYGKSGGLCIRCRQPLEKMLIQSRTTVFCPRCQE